MSTRELERELAVLLHRHAEDAMDSTDTQAEHERLNDVLDTQPHTDRRRLAVGAVAAAAVAAAAVVWSLGGGDDRAGLPPTLEPDTGRAADEAAAQGFVTAYGEGDVELAGTFLAPSNEMEPGWRRGVQRDVAWNANYLLEPCQMENELPSGTYFVCRFDVHVLSSEEVGAGPFEGSMFQVVVEDGEVLYADVTFPFETNGMMEHVDAFWAWLEENHPADTTFLGQDEPDVPEADWDRWLRLYEKRADEYADAMASERNG